MLHLYLLFPDHERQLNSVDSLEIQQDVQVSQKESTFDDSEMLEPNDSPPTVNI
jgi:hypothetical protein